MTLTLPTRQGLNGTHFGVAGGVPSRSDQTIFDTQGADVGTAPSLVDQLVPGAHGTSVDEFSSRGQRAIDTHDPHAAGPSPDDESGATPAPAAMVQPAPTTDSRRGPLLIDEFLSILADSLDDLEKVRIATENRYRALTRAEVDSDGEMRGLGMDDSLLEVARVGKLVEGLRKLEHDADLELRRHLRKHPLYGWVKRQKGVGEKQAARLLAAIRDPYWNDLHDRPRTVSELWAFAGYAVRGGEADRRRKGVKANWSSEAKMRAYLVAVSCVKSTGEYRAVYEDGRAQYEDAVHPHPCVRCGPAGKPAPEGSPLSAGHQHNRALRLVSKRILRDLWVEARDFYETT